MSHRPREKERGKVIYNYLRAAMLHPDQHPQLASLVVKNQNGRLHCRSREDCLTELTLRVEALEESIAEHRRRVAAMETQIQILVAVLVKLVSGRMCAQV